MICYLAGPMHGLSFANAAAWRETVDLELSLFGVRCLTPLRDKESIAVFNSTTKPETFHETPAAITTRDRFDVFRSDVVFMNLLDAKRSSIGTCIEAGWCDIYRKPLVIVAEPSLNPHDHPMMRDIAAYWLPSIDDGIVAVKSLLGI